MNTTATRTADEQKVIDRVEAELVSGRTFGLKVTSNRSVPLGGAPIAARGYSGVMVALAKFANGGDWHVAAVREALGKVNPYLTPNEVVAQVAEALAKFVREGYFDVIGSTGPEASRPSAHQHPVTLRQALLLSLLMTEVEMSAGYIGHVPGVGWCVSDLIKREGVTAPAYLLPQVAKYLSER